MKSHNNTMHSDGQGYGVYSLYQVWCLIAFFKCPFILPAGDGGRYILSLAAGKAVRLTRVKQFATVWKKEVFQ